MKKSSDDVKRQLTKKVSQECGWAGMVGGDFHLLKKELGNWTGMFILDKVVQDASVREAMV